MHGVAARQIKTFFSLSTIINICGGHPKKWISSSVTTDKKAVTRIMNARDRVPGNVVMLLSLDSFKRGLGDPWIIAPMAK